jgi:hypothetical protein
VRWFRFCGKVIAEPKELVNEGVNVVDVQTVSIVIASASVVAGVIYYALQLRHQTKMRKIDLLTRLYSTMVNKDWLDAWQKVQEREVLDHGDYLRKYGFVELNEVFMFFAQVGMLLKRGLIDVDLIPFTYGQVKITWEKVKPVIEGGRKRFDEPKLGDEVEYLCSELEKREKRGAKNG